MRLCLTLCFALLAAVPWPALTADEIARRVQDRDSGRDSRAELRMKLFDRRDRVRERALSLLTLRGRAAPGAPKTAPDGDRLLIRFTYPNDIRGTSSSSGSSLHSGAGRALSLPPRRSAASAALPAARRRRASSAAISPTRTSAAATRRLHLRAPRRFVAWSRPGGAVHPAYRLESTSQGSRRPSSRAWFRSCGKTPSSSCRPRSTTGGREAEGYSREAR